MSFTPDSLYTWEIQTGAANPVTILNRRAYICKSGVNPVVFQLPASCNMGFAFKIIGHSNSWIIQQNAGQFCTIGSSNSTAGINGSISSTQVKDQIWVVCVTQNTEFNCFPAGGNPKIV